MAEYIFAVDSDGCAMDTMTYKHELFFGPLAAEEFEVEDKDTFQENWEQINLYTKTRGVNRFVGLVMGLESIDYDVINIENLKKWVNETASLSNDSLEVEINKTDSDDLKRALTWSNAVNKNIAEAEGHDEPFPGVIEGLEKMQELGKVYVVSSANREAVEDEWIRHGLMEHVDDLYCQDRGKKADVLAGFIANGTDSENILMVGDSPGDLEAAEQNDTWFFPIIVGDEEASWKELHDNVAEQAVAGNFTQEDQDKYKDQFWSNLEN
jgi:phosphoglycolate phosphatase-like HAD superfamily hydrolase